MIAVSSVFKLHTTFLAQIAFIMLKQILYTLGVIVVLGVFSSGCLVEINGDSETVRGQGPLAQEFREIGPVNGVNLAMEGDLFIQSGPEASFRVEAQQNILAYINTYVRNDVLIIEAERDVDLRPSEPVRFVLVTPELNSISLTGSGDVQVDPFESPEFALSVAGSGDLLLRELLTDNLVVSIAGSGDINVDGSTINQEVSIAGSGDYNARDLVSTAASISIAGSGDSYVQVSDELTASLIGSGSVFYLGNPTITSSSVGSGTIRRLNN